MNTTPSLFIYRNQDKALIQRIVNNANLQDDSSDLSNRDNLSTGHLHAMMLIARMKESADRSGAGFVGGFVTPSGERFVMSNIDEDDVQYKEVNRQLSNIQSEVNIRNSKQRIEEEIQSMLEAFED